MTILVSNLQDTDIDQSIASFHFDYKCIDDKYNYILHLLLQMIEKVSELDIYCCYRGAFNIVAARLRYVEKSY